jgi:cell division protein FtsQ
MRFTRERTGPGRRIRKYLIRLVLLSLIIGIFMLIKPALERRIHDLIHEYSHKLNFLIKTVVVEDYDKTYCVPLDESQILTQYIGSPTVLAPVARIKQELHSIDCISKVDVSRVLPSTLKVRVQAKQPIAVLQHRRKFVFITSTGELIQIRTSDGLEGFIIVTGENAEKHVSHLLEIIKVDPELYKKVVAATWIGDRRWNLKFDNDAEVFLPEANPEMGWQRFLKLFSTREEFRTWKYALIDLRVEDRVYAR